MNCFENYGISSYPVCSGHGSCINNVCVCNDGWSSFADFELTAGLDCDIHVPTIKYIALASICFSVPSFFFYIYCFWKERAYEIKKISQPKTLVFFSTLSANISGNIYCAYKFSSPDNYLLGKTVVPTLAYVVVASSICASGTGFFLIIIRFLEGYTRMFGTDRQRDFQETASQCLPLMRVTPVCVFIELLAIGLASVFANKSYNNNIFSILNSLALIHCFVTYTVSMGLVVRAFVKQVEVFLAERTFENQSPSDPLNESADKLREQVMLIHTKITQVYHFVIPWTISGLVFNSIFVGWELLRRKTTYLILILIFLAHLMGPVLDWPLLTINKRKEYFLPRLQTIFQSSRVQPQSNSNSVRVSQRINSLLSIRNTRSLVESSPVKAKDCDNTAVNTYNNSPKQTRDGSMSLRVGKSMHGSESSNNFTTMALAGGTYPAHEVGGMAHEEKDQGASSLSALPIKPSQASGRKSMSISTRGRSIHCVSSIEEEVGINCRGEVNRLRIESVESSMC